MRCVFAGLLLAAVSVTGVASEGPPAQAAAAPELKAAFILNFARFSEWPDMPPAAPLVLCVLGDERVLDALTTAARAQRVDDHHIQVARMTGDGAWKSCQVLFVGELELKGVGTALDAVRTSPVLTVSDQSHFALATGMIELFADGGRMKFAVNVDSVRRARLHLSSRLLRLAKIVRNEDVER